MPDERQRWGDGQLALYFALLGLVLFAAFWMVCESCRK